MSGEKNDERFPGILECTQSHENVHLGQNIAKSCDCAKDKGTFIPKYPGGNGEMYRNECEAYKVGVECLKKNMIKECGVEYNSGYDPDGDISDCVFRYDWAIRSNIRYRDKYCAGN